MPLSPVYVLNWGDFLLKQICRIQSLPSLIKSKRWPKGIRKYLASFQQGTSNSLVLPEKLLFQLYRSYLPEINYVSRTALLFSSLHFPLLFNPPLLTPQVLTLSCLLR